MKRIVLILSMLAAATVLTPLQTAEAATCANPALTGFSAPALAYVGDKPTAIVKLSCAPAAKIKVSLVSDSTYLPVPAAVTISPKHTTAAIALKPLADFYGQYTAKLTATYGASSLTTSITIDPGLTSFGIPACSQPNCVDPNVNFSGQAPAGGLTVKFTSSDPAVVVPASFTFQQYATGGGPTGVIVKPVTKNTKVTLSATLGSRTLNASVVLLPPWTTKDSLKIFAEAGPGPIYGQDFFLEYIVRLSNPAPASGETVTFGASSPAIEPQGTTTYIVPGFTDAYLQINVANVTKPVHAKITATVSGVKTSVPVTIEPGLASITNVPATIVGGNSFIATVSLAGPVDNATTISLGSTWGILAVPATVVVKPGHSSASFLVTTSAVTANSDVNITALLGSTMLTSGTVTLTP